MFGILLKWWMLLFDVYMCCYTHFHYYLYVTDSNFLLYRYHLEAEINESSFIFIRLLIFKLAFGNEFLFFNEYV